ncbi:MAG: DUF3768 domain-containing protein [Candidatus Poribacteria bacterium]|nr:DUF3768 domain-containing protein [Candidatus Poribacteria bacterium]
MRHAFNCFCSRCAAQRIQTRNDAFRKEVLTNPDINNKGGRCSVTQGVHSLPPDALMAVLLAVRNYDTFDPEDDPYGEHDFGVIELPNLPKIYWKIDYYEDANMEFGTEDRLNAYRVLMVMLADEY